MLPNKLKNMNLFVDGYGMAGKVTECTLPKIDPKNRGTPAPAEWMRRWSMTWA